MMLIDGENQVYTLDRDNTVFHVPNLQVWLLSGTGLVNLVHDIVSSDACMVNRTCNCINIVLAMSIHCCTQDYGVMNQTNVPGNKGDG